MEIVGFEVKQCKAQSCRQTKATSRGGWSAQEKSLILEALDEKDMLEWPLRDITLGDGTVEKVYDIPPDKVHEALRRCWMFADESFPKPGGVLYDIHESKCVEIDKCLILRYKSRNIIVSPYYPKSGGTIIDLIEPPPANAKAGDPIVCMRQIKPKEAE